MTSSAAPHAQNSSAFTPFDSFGFSIGGSNGRNNLVTIDGGENEYGSGTLRTPNISIDSVQEFQVNGSPFLAAGPFNVSGDKNLPSTEPLGFTAASNPRQISVWIASGVLKFAGSTLSEIDPRSCSAKFFRRDVKSPSLLRLP